MKIKSYFYGDLKLTTFMLDLIEEQLQEVCTANITIKLNNFENVYANDRTLLRKDNKGRFRRLGYGNHASKEGNKCHRSLRGLKHEGNPWEYKTLMRVYQALLNKDYKYMSVASNPKENY
jgi:hypothetical protein